MSLPTFDHLIFQHYDNDEYLLKLTINRPDKLNALNNKLLTELEKAIIFFENSDRFRVLLITGSGKKAFVAGADISELSHLNRQSGEEISTFGQKIFNSIENCSKPIIAAINGYALGGGAELAMACHIRYASENALIGLPEVTLGLIPGYGGTQRLPKLVGLSKATEMILTGKPINARIAKEIGFVTDVYPANELMPEAEKTANIIAKNGPLAISKALKALRISNPLNGLPNEAALFGELCDTDDFKEGTQAFLDKRKPEFKNK